ncbi:MAG: 50S ribosomal protein L6 [Candidatus Altiarchaeota archaeon]|nr:50S ribosomal protein L6 [Candidatus Altiarchaeota archaeon]
MRAEIEITEGAKVEVKGKVITLTGPLGTLTRDYTHMPLVSFSVKDNLVIIETPRERRQDKMFLNTAKSHVSNMITGVTKGYKYELEIVHVHFPIRVNVKGNDIVVENFLGSKVPRKSWKYEDVTVKVNGKQVSVEGLNKEHVGQTSANLEHLTHVRDKDRRVFKDGVYLTNRGHINE